MEYETVGQELVKCVLVGDTATGKTRLVCARALNARVSIQQLLRQHVPTVWAIDQYRMYKEVLERSITIVDNVEVSLRLWDTFGDITKNRSFAYGRSDVILLCYSIGNRNSLLHCKTMWYPEIKKFCPDTPVILVGCKNDLRFLCKDPTYLAFCRDRSPFLRPTRECDIVMPEQGRAVAKELGIPYYETSVFTYHGVNQVFENAIRCALICRRNQRFWMTNLKHVQPPQLQAPYCPPKRELKEINVYPSTYNKDMLEMSLSKHCPDLVFVTGDSEISAHRFVIASANPALEAILETLNTYELFRFSRRLSEISYTSDSTSDETECLLKSEESFLEGNDNNACTATEVQFNAGEFDNLIQSVYSRTGTDDVRNLELVVELSDTISEDTWRSILHFCYTGELVTKDTTCLESLKRVAKVFKNEFLSQYLDAWSQKDVQQLSCIRKSFRQHLKSSTYEKCTTEYCCDVLFYLDDGKAYTHKAILMARSEMMKAMFSQDFRERRSFEVSLPDVKKDAFLSLLQYLYTDSVTTPVPTEAGMEVLELANRLCLVRLVNFIEKAMIEDYTEKQALGVDILENCIRLLEPAQLHNIEQLAQWCLIQISTNYDAVCRKHGKVFKELSPENKQWVSQLRWPPVWYVKDNDFYQKAMLERCKKENNCVKKKSRKRNSSGCLWFPGKSRKNSSDDKLEKPLIRGGY